MAGRLHLELESKLEALGQISAALESFGEEQGWAPELQFHVQLVLDELASNVIEHGYGAGEGRFWITIESRAEELRIEVVDEARAYDPLSEAPEAMLEGGVAEREVGGLGVHIVKQLMDELEYRREGGKNRLTLLKRHAAADGLSSGPPSASAC